MQDNDQIFNVLLEKYFSREISYNDKELLFSMIMESDHYRESYEKIARLNTFTHISAIESQKEKNYNKLKKQIGEDIHPKRRKLWLTFSRIAAVIVLIISTSISSVYIYKNYLAKAGQQDVAMLETSTPLGGESKILLPDGSIAWLNAKSELKYSVAFGKNDRKLYLSGEAYFEVSKNKKIPFIVKTDHMEITATGTIFNVRSYPEDEQSEVQLIEGGIDVLAANHIYHLTVNEKVVYEKITERAIKLREKEIYDKTTKQVMEGQEESYDATQWTKGKLSFDKASLPEIIRDIERKFNVLIQIESEQIKTEYFMGSINLDMDLDSVLKFIDVDKKYEIEKRGNVITIKDKKMKR